MNSHSSNSSNAGSLFLSHWSVAKGTGVMIFNRVDKGTLHSRLSQSVYADCAQTVSRKKFSNIRSQANLTYFNFQWSSSPENTKFIGSLMLQGTRLEVDRLVSRFLRPAICNDYEV